MPEIYDIQDTGTEYQEAGRHVVRRPPLQGLLSYLVFEAHGLRIGLEITLCVACYSFLFSFLPWDLIGVPARWSGLLSWFCCCSLVILFDQLLLCRSAYALRKSYLLHLGGAFEQALQTLEQIGPRSSTFVPLPQHIYHLYRAEVFVQARNFVKAENELNFAQNNEADSGRIAVLRSMIHRLKGEYAAAEQELESAISTTRQASVLFFEAAMLNFDLGNNPWEAKRMFREVLEKPEMPHYAGETTHQLAKAYWNACRLKTGEAEEGLEQLSWFIERFRSAVAYIDTLRPYLSRLLLERSAYFAGHGDPAAALVDLRTAIVFCAYPSVLDKAEVIKDELEWRYKLPLVW